MLGEPKWPVSRGEYSTFFEDSESQMLTLVFFLSITLGFLEVFGPSQQSQQLPRTACLEVYES